jgi:predicted hydrocarbon binding protein
MFRELVGPTRVKIGRRPVSLRVEQSLSARADPGGAACALYSGAFARLLELYTGRRYRVLHPVCATKEVGQACEWVVELAS